MSMIFLGFHCGTEHSAGAALRFVEPAPNASFGRADSVRIIVESDYSRFTSGIILDFSVDSAKTWQFLKSFGRKEGLYRDTLSWLPAADLPSLAAGNGILIMARDYDRNFSERSGFFFLSN